MTRPLLCVLFCLLALSLVPSCVNVDPETGETIPRGDQRYDFSDVTKNAERLKVGMTKYQTLLLLGSPAEKRSHGNVWVYLPERPALIIPGRFLQLEFQGGILKKHGYHAIVLGAQM